MKSLVIGLFNMVLSFSVAIQVWSDTADLTLRYTDRPESLQISILKDAQGKDYLPLVDAAKFYGIVLDFDAETGRITLSKGDVQAKLVLYQSLFLATHPTQSFLIDPVELIGGQLAITPSSAEDLLQVVLDKDVQFMADQQSLLVGFVPDNEATPGMPTPTPLSSPEIIASVEPTATDTPEVQMETTPVETPLGENPEETPTSTESVEGPSTQTLVNPGDEGLENIQELPESGTAEEEENSAAGPGEKVETIIIDPGHGGVDRGATGYDGEYFEKQATLSIARKVVALLQKRPGLQVFMTRTSDYYISLKYRTTFANRHKGDLFVSIHCNSNPNHGGNAHGTEIYVYSNKALNKVAGVEAVRENGFTQPLDFILNDLYNHQFREKSYALANLIHDRIQVSLGQHMRKVVPGPFYVLARVDMPSILVETAFISNRAEEQKLENDEWQDKMAKAIAGGILDYKQRMESSSGNEEARR